MAEAGGGRARVVALVGPTAVGKTETAVRLAQAVGGEVVTVDSRQVYRYLDIGTAKPTPAEQGGIPHHLLDMADPDRTVTAADFVRAAQAAVAAVRARGRWPLLVGGTGFWLRALLRPLTFHGAPPNPALRAALAEEVRRGGPGLLWSRLARVWPERAQSLSPSDTPRLVRALEIVEHWGGPPPREDPPPAPYDALVVGLTLPREVLYRRIDRRVLAQVDRGLVDEVRRVLALGFSPRLPPLRGLAYQEMIAYLLGRLTFREAVRLYQRNTRHLAKRQWTWFRREPDIVWLQADRPDLLAVLVEKMAERWPDEAGRIKLGTKE